MYEPIKGSVHGDLIGVISCGRKHEAQMRNHAAQNFSALVFEISVHSDNQGKQTTSKGEPLRHPCIHVTPNMVYTHDPKVTSIRLKKNQ